MTSYSSSSYRRGLQRSSAYPNRRAVKFFRSRQPYRKASPSSQMIAWLSVGLLFAAVSAVYAYAVLGDHEPRKERRIGGGAKKLAEYIAKRHPPASAFSGSSAKVAKKEVRASRRNLHHDQPSMAQPIAVDPKPDPAAFRKTWTSMTVRREGTYVLLTPDQMDKLGLSGVEVVELLMGRTGELQYLKFPKNVIERHLE